MSPRVPSNYYAISVSTMATTTSSTLLLLCGPTRDHQNTRKLLEHRYTHTNTRTCSTHMLAHVRYSLAMHISAIKCPGEPNGRSVRRNEMCAKHVNVSRLAARLPPPLPHPFPPHRAPSHTHIKSTPIAVRAIYAAYRKRERRPSPPSLRTSCKRFPRAPAHKSPLHKH